VPCESGLTDVSLSIEADIHVLRHSGCRQSCLFPFGPRTGASAVTILRYALGQGRDLRDRIGLSQAASNRPAFGLAMKTVR
jgi:hypothetical protein